MIKVIKTCDVEGDQNRGWQVDLIELFDNSEEIGYMKLGFIPKERFIKHYPHIIYYMDKMKGWCGLIKKYENENWERLAKDINLHNRSIGYNEYQNRNQKLQEKEWEFIANQAIKQLHQEYGDIFKYFKEYFVDKCYVDYARVHKKYRGNRYYLKLYQEAHKWSGERNMPFYSSSLKSDESKRVYSNYIKEGLIKVKLEHFKFSNTNRHRITEITPRLI